MKREGIGKPISSPSRTELDQGKRKEFISRCIGILSHAGEFEDARQRGGVCATQWSRAMERRRKRGKSKEKKYARWIRKWVNTLWGND